ncbi:Pimeloyl-ACP methyl ester carboxylesterase [Microbacterium sp. cf046]|uniref:alpha/beta fold hydrolase n=1 Tax=Microbacterium sp. cf046 TaxID=1761803 RepID=UPI0008E49F75|nr:alpha/beta hydrolase [Microbacterium sp. cf046]SFS02812.1 Pimeloyl-ACP methyl ester carboxylesterase [Microbacterium sp. cf046]
MARLPGRDRVVIGALLVAVCALSACTSASERVAPADLDLSCAGEGSPTVILVPGLNTAADTFASLQTQIATDTLVCSYSRAGLGQSPDWPEDLPDPTAGTAADQLRATLEANDIPGPYVMLGWSYGGLVTQAFAARHRDALAGVVFEDSSTIGAFQDESFDLSILQEGGRQIDFESTIDEVEGLELADIPTIVLTQGNPEDDSDASILEWWTELHDALAALSGDSVHVIATDAGHAIHWDSEALVEKAVDSVVAAVRSGDQLPACDDVEWVPYGGECRTP